LVNNSGIEIADDELQEFADKYREKNELFDVQDFEEWMSEINEYNTDHFEQYITTEYLRKKMFDGFSYEQIEKYYHYNIWRYYFFSLAKITVAEKGIAQELLSLLIDDRHNFYELAAKFSLDETNAQCGGRCGTLMGRDLGQEATLLVIETIKKGQVFCLIQQNEFYEIFLIEAWTAPEINKYTAEVIKKDILVEKIMTGRNESLVNTN
jgi:hypothetical protein